MAVFGTGKATVAAGTATLICSPGAACSVYLINMSMHPVWLGNSTGVTAVNGTMLPAGIPIIFPVTAACSIYGIGTSGPADVHFITGA